MLPNEQLTIENSLEQEIGSPTDDGGSFQK